MGVQNLSINYTDFDREGELYGILVHERYDDGGPRDLRLVWSTEYGSDPNYQWVISVSARGRLKGRYEMGQWMTATQTFPASQCHETAPDGEAGRVWWSHGLDVGGLMDRLCGKGRGWLYATRVYDSIELTASVHSNWTDEMVEIMGGQTGSDNASLDFAIGYCPEYTLTRAYYAPGDLLVVEYDTTWTRIDDRFSIDTAPAPDPEKSSVDGQVLMREQYNGTIAAKGRLEIPTSYLTRNVMGSTVWLHIYFNATYRPIGLYFNDAYGTLLVENGLTCSTPVLRVLSQGDTIRIGTSDSRDEKVSSERVTVKMVGSDYAADQVTVDMGEVAEFRYPPLGRTLSFNAVGSTDDAVSRLSNTVYARSASQGGSILLDPVAGGPRVELRLRTEWDGMGPEVSVSPEVTKLKLANRKTQSAFYGTGRTKSVSFSAAVLEGDARDAEALPEYGDLMCRFPDGRRYCICPEVKVTRKTGWYVLVDVSGEEVGA